MGGRTKKAQGNNTHLRRKNSRNERIDHVIEAGAGANTKIWNTEKLKAIMDVHKPMFESKGVEVFVSHKQEWVSHGNGAGHFVHFRWIEFVDREEQPTYSP